MNYNMQGMMKTIPELFVMLKSTVGVDGVRREHLWGRSPFRCPVRGRREHGEQIKASTRAVYPGSGRDGRVKPYSCLVVLNWGARELGELATPSVWLSGFRMSEPPDPPLRCTRASFYSAKGSPTGVNVRERGKSVKGVEVVTVREQWRC